MHDYVTTFVGRVRTTAILALVAGGLALLVAWALNKLNVEPPFWLAPPGALGAFGFAFFVYDRWLWRLRLPFGLHLSAIPDLNGYWQGQIDIRADRGAEGENEDGIEKHHCIVRIRQRWATISVSFETKFTRSRSLMASFGPPEDPHGGLVYEYDVAPKAGVETGESIGRHFGVARMQPEGDGWKQLVGEFFNDRSYQRWGVYELIRQGSTRPAAPWEESSADSEGQSPGRERAARSAAPKE